MHRLLTLGAIFAAFGVRLYHLGAESLWYDETVSVHLARLPLDAMLAHTAGDIHPPGYYALLHAWQVVTAPTLATGLEFLFAFPSLFFGVLALSLLYAIGCRLFGRRTGLAALWLGAFAPFLVWYSQEVRMYTLGAFLGLLCLWALLAFAAASPATPAAQTAPATASTMLSTVTASTTAGRRRLRWLTVYVLVAAAGLYTLYYFLFLLVALNLIAMLLFLLYEKSNVQDRRRQVLTWLAAQAAVLLLWLPWLPTFWRQATDPPVPAWRAPWDSPAAFFHSLAETLAALLVGQTPPGGSLPGVLQGYLPGLGSAAGAASTPPAPTAGAAWPWAIVTVLLLSGLFIVAATRAGRCTTDWARTRLWLAVATVLLYVFVPIAILYAATLAGTPIYHVRYLALVAPLFLLVPAWLFVNATRLRTWLGAALWFVLLGTFAFALLAFWTNPLYRADDHRAAVADLSQRWRPGDAILANAGWIYPILTTYWPGGVALPAPPPLQPPQRLPDYAKNPTATTLAAPLVLRSGSVDGPTSLGWGDPASDFFAISKAETTAALDILAQQASRIWHYRLYDTVSDPTGAIRTWLATNTVTVTESLIQGRDYGQVQLFTTPLGAPIPITESLTAPYATFGSGALTLASASVPPTGTAGSYLYADLLWHAGPPLATLPADLSASLRLYAADGQLITQADGPLHPAPTRTWDTAHLYPQLAALPVPAGLMPGTYALAMVVYRQDNAEALPVDSSGEQVWRLADIQVLK